MQTRFRMTYEEVLAEARAIVNEHFFTELVDLVRVTLNPNSPDYNTISEAYVKEVCRKRDAQLTSHMMNWNRWLARFVDPRIKEKTDIIAVVINFMTVEVEASTDKLMSLANRFR